MTVEPGRTRKLSCLPYGKMLVLRYNDVCDKVLDWVEISDIGVNQPNDSNSMATSIASQHC